MVESLPQPLHQSDEFKIFQAVQSLGGYLPEEGFGIGEIDLIPMQHLWIRGGLVNISFYRRAYGVEYENLRLELGERALQFMMVESEKILWRQRA